jgi:hypothetical protein
VNSAGPTKTTHFLTQVRTSCITAGGTCGGLCALKGWILISFRWFTHIWLVAPIWLSVRYHIRFSATMCLTVVFCSVTLDVTAKRAKDYVFWCFIHRNVYRSVTEMNLKHPLGFCTISYQKRYSETSWKCKAICCKKDKIRSHIGHYSLAYWHSSAVCCFSSSVLYPISCC